MVADFTLTIGFAKHGLVADAAVNHVGRLAVLPLEPLAQSTEGTATIATPASLARLLRHRDFDIHKGTCGRVGIIAGSMGMSGAAILCAEGALRGGAGLVTLYVPHAVHRIVAARAAPEVMVRAIDSPLEALDAPHDVLAIGPGLGRDHAGSVRELIVRSPMPTVLDADALNILAESLDLLDRCAGLRLLTPHPGEMARLDPGARTRSRRETVEAWTARFPHTLLLKGARTVVGERGRPLSYNSTGHPGMASGGMGDVLTGLVSALIGQGLALYHAAQAGSWLTGRAAELAIFEGPESAESLRATACTSAATSPRRSCVPKAGGSGWAAWWTQPWNSRWRS